MDTDSFFNGERRPPPNTGGRSGRKTVVGRQLNPQVFDPAVCIECGGKRVVLTKSDTNRRRASYAACPTCKD